MMLVPCIECGASMADDADRCGSCRHAPCPELTTIDGPVISVLHPLRPPLAGRIRGNDQQLWLDVSPPHRLFKNPQDTCTKLEVPPQTRSYLNAPAKLHTRQMGIYELRGDLKALTHLFRALGVRIEVARPWQVKLKDRLKKGGWLPTITLVIKECSAPLAYLVLGLCVLACVLVLTGHGPALVQKHRGWSAGVLLSALLGVVLSLDPRP